jgi:2-oxo-4-hydroxy-4-carboxy-5-ureidoimidazoline decarboxylase
MEPWRQLDDAAPDEARARLTACCGSARWVEAMLARRPFGSTEALLASARAAWFALAPEDWLEAFSHHPRIGERAGEADRTTATAHLSIREQAAVKDGAPDVLAALAAANRAYEARFGHIFVISASGMSAAAILGALEARLSNAPQVELRMAAGEQSAITQKRLLGLT